VTPSGVVVTTYHRAGGVPTGSFALAEPTELEVERRERSSLEVRHGVGRPAVIFEPTSTRFARVAGLLVERTSAPTPSCHWRDRLPQISNVGRRIER